VTPDVDTLSEKPPRFIGKYEVRGELGHGGMAVVYRAHDPTLDRDVAVKVLHPHLAQDPESRMRFEREAKAAARLRHPNIVDVYEFSGDTDEASFMVTEILGGPTLRKFVEGRDPLPSEIAAAIGIVLCDALTCAHAQGVIHRDVKPDNLMLSKGKLKLTDFGIAHVADQREMTATGQVLGSPAHMAPEQIEGTLVDARTDIFAAGTVLYLLATGRLPFDGPNPHSLLRKILDGDYPDPLRSSPRIGHRFAAIVRRAMARIPEDRFPDAASLRHALTALCAEVGWDDPVRELDRYFADPEGVTERLQATLIAKLPALGLAARARGDVSEAMGYFNRALALDPGNAKVLALVREQARAHRRKRTMRAATIVAAAAVGSTVLGLTLSWMIPPAPQPMVATALPQRVTPPREVVPAHLAATARPVVPDDVPAAETAPPVRTAIRPPERHANDAPSAPVVLREVNIAPNPQNVMYKVNGGRLQSFNSQVPFRLPVGQSAHIEAFLDGYQDFEWRGVIEPGSGVQLVVVRMRRPPVDADTSTRAGHP
jgi:serine/threonine-protein kinase